MATETQPLPVPNELPIRASTPASGGRRLESLSVELRCLRPAFGNLTGLITDFLRAFPVQENCNARSDADRLLWWLESHFSLNNRQRDCVALLRSRHCVERLLISNAARVQQFEGLSDQWRVGVSVHLNPARTWSRLLTDEFTDCELGCSPCNALFFARSGEIATATFGLENQVLLNELAEFQPCTVETWSAHSSIGGIEQLKSLCQELGAMRLVAFA